MKAVDAIAKSQGLAVFVLPEFLASVFGLSALMVIGDDDGFVIEQDPLHPPVRTGYDTDLLSEPGKDKIEDRAATGKGDCIDCYQCVQVCPTGIDIRNGTQLECVNCTACIDACNQMMEAVNLPKNLIKYASEEHIEKKSKFEFTPRLKGYTAVLVILIGVLTGMLFLRNDVEATVLRLPGQLYEHKGEDVISNVYTFKLFNLILHGPAFVGRQVCREGVYLKVKRIGLAIKCSWF